MHSKPKHKTKLDENIDPYNRASHDETIMEAWKNFWTNGGWKKVKFWRNIGAVLILSTGLWGLILSWDSENKDRDMERISKSRAEKLARQEKAITGAMEIRKAREEVFLKCKYGHSLAQEQQDSIRFNARYKAVLAFIGLQHIFGIDVYRKAVEYIQFDEKINDVCNKTAPTDEKWHLYVREINNLMSAYLQKDDADLARLAGTSVAK